MLSEIYSGNKERKDNKVAQIIWNGNKIWENVWDGNQPWDREIAKKSIPEKAVLIDRPDDIIKASIPYMIIPCIVCFVAVFTKKAQVARRKILCKRFSTKSRISRYQCA